MKISVQQYAQSLFDSVKGKSEKEAKEIIKNFVVFLGRNQGLSKAQEIIKVFENIWSREEGELTAGVITARALGKESRELIIDYLKKKTASKEINLQEKIDEGLLGGFVLTYGSRIIDASLKNSLADLKNKISN